MSVPPAAPAPSRFTAAHRGGSGSPLVCLHGFTDTWRSWELCLPYLERRHDVFAPTLPGHLGGPAIELPVDEEALLDQVEGLLDEAGIATAHIAGNSLGGFIALKLAARGRARSIVALAPAGGWAADDPFVAELLAQFPAMQAMLRVAAPQAEALLATAEGRRQATQLITVRYAHIPAELIAHLMVGAAGCTGLIPLVEHAEAAGWELDVERIACPVRIVWGTADMVLPWPRAAFRYRTQLFPNADWIELQDVGHCPQLDRPLETAELITGFTAR